MILNPFRQNPQDDSIAALYGAIVAQARNPAFYRSYGVPDTVNGRFEMVVVHAVLLLSRLEAEAGLQRFGQGVFDYFCSDMDGNLREMGVGDIVVPRKMKAIGEAFYGRKRAYNAAISEPRTDSLAAALARNVYGEPTAGVPGALALAAYMIEATSKLAALDTAALSRGQAQFPDPATFSPSAAAGAA